MRRGGGFALADAEDEDAWAKEDEAEFQGMAYTEAGGPGHVISLRFGTTRMRVDRPTRPLPLPLWRVEAHGHRIPLSEALLLTLEENDGEGVIIGNPDLRMWGVGDDVYKALEDFSSTFVSVFRSYDATPPEQLTEDAREYLATLRSLIAEE
jgi:hypothetical protein